MATVAVIGAGPQGLVTLKNLREEGFDATVFESRPSIGGVWQYTEDWGETSVLRTTLGNVSKYRNSFTDFPVPDDAPVHMNAQETLDYIHSYAAHFRLHDHIQLSTRVQRIVRTSDDQQWQLSMSRNGRDETKLFDKVVFCTGNTQVARVPRVESCDVFKGTIVHSQNFKRPELFSGQSVLVVGLGSTAADIACDLVGHASRIYLSHRRGNHILARWCQGKPLDMYSNRRMAYIRDTLSAAAPQTAQKFLDGAVAKLADSCFDLDPAWNFKPAPSILTHRPLISDDLVDDLRNGSIASVAGAKRFTDDRHVKLDDGSSLKVDAVVFATGYTADFSLMPEHSPLAPLPSVSSSPPLQHRDQQNQFPTPPLARLYQNIFLPTHPNSIAYLSNWTLGDGILPISDLASMAIAQVWRGTFPLPSRLQMESAIDAHHAWVRTAAGGSGTLREVVQQGKWMAWLHDAAGTGVNERLGYGLKGWWWWAWESRFCGVLMGGVDSPFVMRLFEGSRGKGKGRKRWSGAREAILRANEEVERRIAERRERVDRVQREESEKEKMS